MFNFNTGKKIKELRESKDLTQVKLANKINSTKNQISAWENFRSYPGIVSLSKLASALDTTIDYLCNDK